MKTYKYVRLGFRGESEEISGQKLRRSAKSHDLNRLLEEGWCPVRETVVDYQYERRFQTRRYPFVLILLEKETGPSGGTGITATLSKSLPAK